MLDPFRLLSPPFSLCLLLLHKLPVPVDMQAEMEIARGLHAHLPLWENINTLVFFCYTFLFHHGT